MDAVVTAERPTERAARWLETLSQEIGPRRPTSRAERVAAEWLRGELAAAGVPATDQPFGAYSTFALPHGAIVSLALAAGAIPGRFRRLRVAAAVAAAGLGVLEDDPRARPISRLFARRPSRNLVASLEPRGEPVRTLCLVAHIDSSRSGWLFAPLLAPRLRGLLSAISVALLVQGLEGLRGRVPGLGALLAGSRALLALGLGLLAERELRGEDVPGANDNASGAAAVAELAAEAAAEPLAATRLVLLVTGAEEAGTLGAEAFLRAHDTRGWLFLNFDGVAAPATLRYLDREGLVRTWEADAGLIACAERLSRARPKLGLARMEKAAGLTYDATPVLARGGRALTVSAQDGTIPNYHRPSDHAGNVDAETLARALEIGRELIAAVDRGEADRHPVAAPRASGRRQGRDRPGRSEPS